MVMEGVDPRRIDRGDVMTELLTGLGFILILVFAIGTVALVLLRFLAAVFWSGREAAKRNPWRRTADAERSAATESAREAHAWSSDRGYSR
jgi:hypothetical protein